MSKRPRPAAPVNRHREVTIDPPCPLAIVPFDPDGVYWLYTCANDAVGVSSVLLDVGSVPSAQQRCDLDLFVAHHPELVAELAALDRKALAARAANAPALRDTRWCTLPRVLCDAVVPAKEPEPLKVTRIVTLSLRE